MYSNVIPSYHSKKTKEEKPTSKRESISPTEFLNTLQTIKK